MSVTPSPVSTRSLSEKKKKKKKKDNNEKPWTPHATADCLCAYRLVAISGAGSPRCGVRNRCIVATSGCRHMSMLFGKSTSALARTRSRLLRFFGSR